MNYPVNETHDAKASSWVESANTPETEFPIQNLPYCVFSREHGGLEAIGVVIGDRVLDLCACADKDLLGDSEQVRDACSSIALNGLMELRAGQLSKLRKRIFGLLRAGSSHEDEVAPMLVPLSKARLQVPALIGDYTDFYASLHHATNVGKMFRPDNPLLPNYKWVPIGYHGRASSIVMSGSPIVRPKGQTRDDDALPVFGPSKRLDYEMEAGFFIAHGNKLGEPIPLARAEEHIFGVCLVNDWSARDIQTWEYQPLGPFLAKNFATTVSPFVVTVEALAPFRVAAFQRDAGDPQPLDYLADPDNEQHGGIDLTVEVQLSTAKMREQKMAPVRVSRGNFRDMYWTAAQMLTHHASNGCNLQAGDLFASGTISGTTKDSRGCLLELTWRGTEPLELPTGETRRFLEDGDEVIMRGYCEREGYRRIGFGECRGTIQGNSSAQ